MVAVLTKKNKGCHRLLSDFYTVLTMWCPHNPTLSDNCHNPSYNGTKHWKLCGWRWSCRWRCELNRFELLHSVTSLKGVNRFVSQVAYHTLQGLPDMSCICWRHSPAIYRNISIKSSWCNSLQQLCTPKYSRCFLHRNDELAATQWVWRAQVRGHTQPPQGSLWRGDRRKTSLPLSWRFKVYWCLLRQLWDCMVQHQMRAIGTMLPLPLYQPKTLVTSVVSSSLFQFTLNRANKNLQHCQTTLFQSLMALMCLKMYQTTWTLPFFLKSISLSW